MIISGVRLPRLCVSVSVCVSSIGRVTRRVCERAKVGPISVSREIESDGKACRRGEEKRMNECRLGARADGGTAAGSKAAGGFTTRDFQFYRPITNDANSISRHGPSMNFGPLSPTRRDRRRWSIFD